MLVANYISWDPVAPWSSPGLGTPLLAGTAILLVALTLWTYLGVRGATSRRLAAVILLRLVALAVAFLLILRPSLAMDDQENVLPSKLIILVDYSESMKVKDAFNKLGRWDDACRILAEPRVADALKRLADAKVEVVYYQGAEDLRAFEPHGQPVGKRTDFGFWLHEILQRHGGEKNLRGVLIFSDGADNGSRFSTREKAALFRGFCPIYPFALGKTNTSEKQNDIALTDIIVEPSPAPVKTKIVVKAFANAPGFEDAFVSVGLYIDELDGNGPRLVPSGKKQVQLKKTERNEIVMTCDAPDKPGEIKVTMKIDFLKGEVTELNNEISTYLSVTTEGVSILWVEGRKWWESPLAIRNALSRDPRFRVYYAEKLRTTRPEPEQEDWFDLNKKHYDVIVIGDIPAARLAEGSPDIFKNIRQKVTKQKSGLVFLGGQETLAAGDWGMLAARDVADLLPIDVRTPTDPRQFEEPIRVQPTDAGLKYLLRLDEDKDKNQRYWNNLFRPLEGMTNLGRVKETATVLATGELAGGKNEPVLVSATQGGRIVVFAGDTTYKAWLNSDETRPAYERFWKQLMLYAAQQENTDSSVWIKLDRRRVPAGSNQRVPFTVGVRGKNGLSVPNPQFTVKVHGPKNEVTEVPVALEGTEYRGYFWRTDFAGEYKVEAFAKGKDAEGNDLPGTPGIARFLGYAEDLELLRTAADHEALEKIAQDSGGRFQIADEKRLLNFLEDLYKSKSPSYRPKVEHWPDWRQTLPPGSPPGDQLRTLWGSAALPCFLLFVALLCVEWFLRRRWGMV